MSCLFLEYPKCSTCRKAKKFLKDKDINFIERDLVKETPTKEEIINYINQSGIDFKRFFNTSGVIYREMKLKDRIKDMDIFQAAELLSSNGMLIKRPILIGNGSVIVGFKEEIYNEIN